MHATATRQAFGRALFPAALRRHIRALTTRGRQALHSAHVAQLQLLIQWTRDDIEKIDHEMAALPLERLDHERTLITLEHRLREAREATAAQRAAQALVPHDVAVFAKAWVEGRTGFAFQPCTASQLYRAYRLWVSHHGLRRGAAAMTTFGVRMREAFFLNGDEVTLDAHITGVNTEHTHVVRCWLPLLQLPEDPHERRRYIDNSIAAFERSLTQ